MVTHDRALADRAREFVEIVKEDLQTYNGQWTECGFKALVVYRFGSALYDMPLTIPRKIVWRVYEVLYRWIRNHYGIDVFYRANVGRRVHLLHQHGIHIHAFCTIGDDCVIRQNVTIGAESHAHQEKAPVLGQRVEVGAGAVIAGEITIGDDVVIGPNAVVMQDIKPNCIAFGNPVRVLPRVKADSENSAD